MGRIRTIKPELFRHEVLFDIEKRLSLPVRLSWIGLFTVVDREGRFKWRPRAMKSEILPYDDCDFEIILNAFLEAGFIHKYTLDGETYGLIISWKDHQFINHREAQSEIPEPTDLVARARTGMHGQARGEGKGKEGKGKEGKGNTPSRDGSVTTFDFDENFDRYPKRLGSVRRELGTEILIKTIRTQEDFDRFSKSVKNYAAHIRGTKQENTEFVLQWSSFAEQWEEWVVVKNTPGILSWVGAEPK